MTIKTETTVVFHYPEERDAEIAFTHDNDMSEWRQSISSQTVSYTQTKRYEVDFGRSERE
jgi:hypothetical protein